MKKVLVALVLVLTLGLTACGEKSGGGESESIKIGVTPVPHAEIIEIIKDDLKKEGVDVEIVEFNDYFVPNISLADGSIDANFFQHEPFFNENKESKNLDLVSIGVVHIEPIALYSDKYKSIDDLEEGAQILIPNDPTNGARALVLLEKAGLIKLKDSGDINATENDIVENPKNFEFTALEAAAIPKAYKDAGAAVINSNFAIKAGLNPVKDGLVIEDSDSPYANLVAVRAGEENEAKFKKLMDALHSDKVKKFLEDKYEGAIVPAF
ncbi:MAG: MetQ/NlpA family ABC transporter substrate-binding protein [Tissierellia bacterium]|nr:MetQ/NlpA family ABC transporter substrate-binding protein [Tissierellia bacterium]